MKGAARLIGVGLFCAGVVIIFVVFFMARGLYAAPLIGHNPNDALIDRLGEAAVTMLIRVLLLIVMSICGALLAGKGVQIYMATLPPEDRANTGRRAVRKRPPGDA
jgi:hypothetical protein